MPHDHVHKIKFLTPQHPQVPNPGACMTEGTEWKSRLICFISFICEKTHKVLIKNLWNRLCNWDLMIFDLFAPPQGPRRRGPKKLCRCMCHSCKLLTHQIWLNLGNKVFGPPNPPRYPQVPPLGHDPGDGMKIPSDMFYILQLWEDTQSLV